MFDIGFSELLLVAVVALIVLGPERLPKAARFAGLWVRRARAQWSSVKAEFERDLADEEFKRGIDDTKASLREMQESLRNAGSAAQRQFDDAREEVMRGPPLPAAVAGSAVAGTGAAEAAAAAAAAAGPGVVEPGATKTRSAHADTEAGLPAAASPDTDAAATTGATAADLPVAVEADDEPPEGWDDEPGLESASELDDLPEDDADYRFDDELEEEAAREERAHADPAAGDTDRPGARDGLKHAPRPPLPDDDAGDDDVRR